MQPLGNRDGNLYPLQDKTSLPKSVELPKDLQVDNFEVIVTQVTSVASEVISKIPAASTQTKETETSTPSARIELSRTSQPKTQTSEPPKAIPTSKSKIEEAGEFLGILAKQTAEAIQHFLEEIKFLLKLQKKTKTEEQEQPISKAISRSTKTEMEVPSPPYQIPATDNPKTIEKISPKLKKEQMVKAEATALQIQNQFKDSVFDKKTSLHKIFFETGLAEAAEHESFPEKINPYDYQTQERKERFEEKRRKGADQLVKAFGDDFKDDLKKYLQYVHSERKNKPLDEIVNDEKINFLKYNILELPPSIRGEKAANMYREKTVQLLLDHYKIAFGEELEQK